MHYLVGAREIPKQNCYGITDLIKKHLPTLVHEAMQHPWRNLTTEAVTRYFWPRWKIFQPSWRQENKKVFINYNQQRELESS